MFNLKSVPNVQEKKIVEHFTMTSIGKISHYYRHKLNAILNTLKILGGSGRYYTIL